MSTDPAGAKSERKRPWYRACLPRPIGWILYTILLLLLTPVSFHVICHWWATTGVRSAGGTIGYGKGGYFITLTKDKQATSLLNPEISRLNSLDDDVSLSLDGTDTTDKALAYLEGLEKLAGLELAYTKVTDAGIPHLAKINHLWRLDLNGTNVTDKGLACLEGLTNLRDLALASTNITDAGIPYLRKFHYVYTLNLAGTRITDDGLAHLEGCANLYFLDLGSTSVTDRGIPHLARVYNLQHLNLAGTKVTDGGVKALRRALPKCGIER